RRCCPDRSDLVVPFAFAVFSAAGVAPLVISNPMNLIVADYAGISFNEYAARMVPIAIAGCGAPWLHNATGQEVSASHPAAATLDASAADGQFDRIEAGQNAATVSRDWLTIGCHKSWGAWM